VKRVYEKPLVESESVFESLGATACTYMDPTLDAGCDPDFGGTVNIAPSHL
jgi:hypothetical protein